MFDTLQTSVISTCVRTLLVATEATFEQQAAALHHMLNSKLEYNCLSWFIAGRSDRSTNILPDSYSIIVLLNIALRKTISSADTAL